METCPIAGYSKTKTPGLLPGVSGPLELASCGSYDAYCDIFEVSLLFDDFDFFDFDL